MMMMMMMIIIIIIIMNIWALYYPPPPTFDHLAIYRTSWRVGETIELVYKYAKTHETHIFMVFCIALGVEPGTSCIRGPVLTNWAVGEISLRSSCSPSCLPPVPLGKRCGQGSLTMGGNPLLQKGAPYYRR